MANTRPKFCTHTQPSSNQNLHRKRRRHSLYDHWKQKERENERAQEIYGVRNHTKHADKSRMVVCFKTKRKPLVSCRWWWWCDVHAFFLFKIIKPTLNAQKEIRKGNGAENFASYQHSTTIVITVTSPSATIVQGDQWMNRVKACLRDIFFSFAGCFIDYDVPSMSMSYIYQAIFLPLKLVFHVN